MRHQPAPTTRQPDACKEIIGVCLPFCHIIIPDLISDMIHKIASAIGVSST